MNTDLADFTDVGGAVSHCTINLYCEGCGATPHLLSDKSENP